MSRNTILIGAAAVLTLVVIVFLLYPRPADQPVPPSGPAPVVTEEERGDTAREVIAELEEADDVDYGEAYRRAEEFRADGRLADAQLLYFFSARGGHGPAAFSLATMHDPEHFSAAASLMDEPDPFQAYRWYVQAREAGIADAAPRLAALKTWAEEADRAGDLEAEQLLLQWDSP